MRQIALATAALAVLPALVATADAQPRANATQQSIAELKTELEQLRAQTVQIPTLAAAVQDLSDRLAVLEQELAKQDTAGAAIPDAIDRIDRLNQAVARLAQEVGALRTRVADIEQPWEPEPSGGGGVAYDGGFSWLTADQRYAIKLGGYVQPRYQLELSGSDVTESTLRLRRARVGASGHLGSKKITYKLLLSGLKSPAALDYYVDHAFRDFLNLRIGQYKTQFARNFMTSSSSLAFVERSRVVEAMRYDRDIQVGLHGMLADKRVGSYVGIGNGAGTNVTNDNLDINATLRVDAVVIGERFKYGFGDVKRTDRPSLMVGAGAVYDLVPIPGDIGGIAINTDTDDDGTVDNAQIVSASADAIFRYRGFEAVAELLLRHESYGSILDHPDNALLLEALPDADNRLYLGVYAQATYMVKNFLMAGARLGHHNAPFLGVGGRSSSLPREKHLLELDALVQFYNPRGQRGLGLLYSLHYFHHHGDSAVTADPDTDHRVIVEGQLKF